MHRCVRLYLYFYYFDLFLKQGAEGGGLDGGMWREEASGTSKDRKLFTFGGFLCFNAI